VLSFGERFEVAFVWQASKEHFQKAWMELGQIRVAFSAEKTDVAHDLGFITSLIEAAIIVLDITRGDNDIVSHFDKIMIIPAMGTGDTHTMFFVAIFFGVCCCPYVHR
jgi:hypothetical protein